MAPYEFNEPLNPDDEDRGPDGMLLTRTTKWRIGPSCLSRHSDNDQEEV